MNGPAQAWQEAADCFGNTLAQVGDEHWEASTGCGDWTVRELVDHTVFWQAGLGAFLNLGTTAEDGWDAIKATISAGLADPGILEGTVEDGPMKGMEKHQAMGFALTDVLVHSWDLARAIGVDDTLPAEACAATLMGMSQVPDAMIRNPNVFGPAIEVADDASDQDKLIAFTGRQP